MQLEGEPYQGKQIIQDHFRSLYGLWFSHEEYGGPLGIFEQRNDHAALLVDYEARI